MALIEDVIFSDPVLQRIFFDPRRFAPRSAYSSSEVAGMEMSISEAKVRFMKSSDVHIAEYWQRYMRREWFAIRKKCDGYLITPPVGHSDGCEHVVQFAHDANAAEFRPDWTARAAYWHKFEQRSPPTWKPDSQLWQKGKRRRRRRRPV